MFSPPFQYIHPTDSHKLGQAELVCIDEAAAIPLPLVKSLLGPYLVFMSSTINGWVKLSNYSHKWIIIYSLGVNLTDLRWFFSSNIMSIQFMQN